MKSDINNLGDIKKLIDSFYENVKMDQYLGPYFLNVVKIDWEKHLPIMYAFWENVIFSTGNYDGNPLEMHRQVHSKYPTTKEQFTRWLSLFIKTIDSHFRGENAEIAKQRAIGIANVMLSKI